MQSSRASDDRTHDRTHDRTPLLGPLLTVPGGGATHIEVEDEDNESESDVSDEEEGDMTPVIKLQSQQKQNPFVKLLLALWPFGESFKQLGVFGKIYEIFKV